VSVSLLVHYYGNSIVRFVQENIPEIVWERKEEEKEEGEEWKVQIMLNECIAALVR